MPFSTLPAGTLPGQRRIIGTRKPPSSAVPLPPANGVWPPSGQVKFSAPLSVVKPMMVSPSRPLSFRYFITEPTMSSICAMPASWIDQPFSELRIAFVLRRQVRDDVHPRRIEPEEERLAGLARLVDELEREVEDLVVHGLHPLRTKLAGVLDLLLADLAPARHHGRIVDVGRPRMHHVARAHRGLQRLRVSSDGSGPPSRRGDRGSRRTRRSRARVGRNWFRSPR